MNHKKRSLAMVGVHHQAARPQPGIAPGYESLAWVPNSSTLIYGERDAVLVDTFLTADATQALADWVMASGKNLTTIYLTHGHGDHFLRHRAALSTASHMHGRWQGRDIVEAMRHELDPPYFNSFWNSRFPRPAPEQLEGGRRCWKKHHRAGRARVGHGRHGYTDTLCHESARPFHRPGGSRDVPLQRRVHPYMAKAIPQSWQDGLLP